MGNLVDSCCMRNNESLVNVIYWEGNTKTLMGNKKRIAGEIMFEFPESMVCDADRFFIGHAMPSLDIDDELKPGKTYFVLPLDIFSSHILSVSSISSFVAHNYRRSPADLKECPLEYIKESNGRVLIKIKSEFMSRHLMNRCGSHDHVDQVIKSTCNDLANGNLCSTPELKKEYEQLVRSKDQIWSPNLDTISEAKKIIWYSPCRFIGMDWQQKEEDL
uniref:uncharacterized protein LOC122604271 n=1 Tax=Erigeron canadensis TaxID=72917 RepID=UPI001CB9AA8A|nr:uncharacterized protein LOC122604271 [Erigeron canadensis]